MTERTPDITLSFQVKAYDIDVGGVVHNSVYLLWLDDVRTAFMEKLETIEHQVERGYMPVLSRTEISYRRAVKFGDRPLAQMHLTHLSKARWRIHCDFVVNGVVTTQAVQEGCVIEIASGRPIPVPVPFIRFWEQKQAALLEAEPRSASCKKGLNETCEHEHNLSGAGEQRHGIPVTSSVS
jgi:acyl-CoA thioester hydrolase